MFRRTFAFVLAAGIIGATAAGASASITLDGSYSATYTRPTWTGTTCASGLPFNQGVCGVIQLAGLGDADFVYVFGPTFDPNGSCFNVDGTFTLTLQSDGSTMTGPLTGLYCPRRSETAHEHSGPDWGSPVVETDSISLAGGTGQFDGLTGSATFNTQRAGADFRGTLSGTIQ